MAMTATVGHAHADPRHIGLVVEHPGPAPTRTVTAYGFWVFLLSDIVMFSCFFAAYAVLADQTAGGPKGSEIFEPRNVAIETVCLLLSSFTCGMASIAADVRNRFWFYLGMAVTCLLGLIFLVIEFREFADLVARGYGPSRSAFLTAFFSLVAGYGQQKSTTIILLITMMAQVFAKGFRADVLRRMMCFALFWHALDIVWVGVFSVVYLLGSGV